MNKNKRNKIPGLSDRPVRFPKLSTEYIGVGQASGSSEEKGYRNIPDSFDPGTLTKIRKFLDMIKGVNRE